MPNIYMHSRGAYFEAAVTRKSLDEVSLLIEPNMCSWFEKWKIPKLNCHPRANNKSSFIYFYGRNNYDILFYLFFSFTSHFTVSDNYNQSDAGSSRVTANPFKNICLNSGDYKYQIKNLQNVRKTGIICILSTILFDSFWQNFSAKHYFLYSL